VDLKGNNLKLIIADGYKNLHSALVLITFWHPH